MSDNILKLYPTPSQEVKLKDLYLKQDLRSLKGGSDGPFVYSNFITSLDGRIAIPHAEKNELVVPGQLANPRDWRLFQELAVQADILLTSGRYLRQYAAGDAQEILRIYDDPQFEDLRQWRLAQGLPPQPDLAVISGRLDFDIPEVLLEDERSLVIVTTQSSDAMLRKELSERTGKLIIAGERSVSGKALVEGLSGLGYRTIYNATGPKVHHLLLADRVLDRMYLTFANRILGGSPYMSIVEGALLDPPADFQLDKLYHDPHALDGLGQLYATFTRV